METAENALLWAHTHLQHMKEAVGRARDLGASSQQYSALLENLRGQAANIECMMAYQGGAKQGVTHVPPSCAAVDAHVQRSMAVSCPGSLPSSAAAHAPAPALPLVMPGSFSELLWTCMAGLPAQPQPSAALQSAGQQLQQGVQPDHGAPPASLPKAETQQQHAVQPPAACVAPAPVQGLTVTPMRMRRISGDAAGPTPAAGVTPAAHEWQGMAASPDSKPCRCKKSRCLKLYCDCFASGTFCNEACICSECLNRTSSLPLVFAARKGALAKDPNAFQPKVAQGTQHVKGCHCRKSRCLKKYCECFLGGARCTDACRCVNCLNKGPGAGGREPPTKHLAVVCTLAVDPAAADATPPPLLLLRRLQHLNQEQSLQEPVADSSASHEGASVKPGSPVGQLSCSETLSAGEQLDTPHAAPVTESEQRTGLQPVHRLQAGGCARQAPNGTHASADDSSMADDATSPPPAHGSRFGPGSCRAGRKRSLARQRDAEGALPSLNNAKGADAGGKQLRWVRQRLQSSRAQQQQPPVPGQGASQPQPTPAEGGCAVTPHGCDVLQEICGNVAARTVFPAKQRGVRMRTVYKANGGQEGFVREEDAAQALLML